MASSSFDERSSAWIKGRNEPSSIDDNFKDGYTDMLADKRGRFTDLPWVLKSVQTPEYKYKHPRNYEQLNKDVINSDRVAQTVEQICNETKRAPGEVWKEAKAILTEMAHKFNYQSVRTLGYGLIKVFKQLHDHIYVNIQGLTQLNELIQEYPVLLVPSHRSYFDFLIMSIMCFNYDLPLPAIVAAQDFKDMFLIGSMLRNSGAFYIKRTFRSDQLYWSIFTEYVQTQLRNGDHPIEFFVEGTRSRTQKSYAPKLGMLAGSLEAYFKGMVPDIMIVPISISYDRVLEENLFAQELLGIPKPKESTSKLFKATSILNERYGSIHVTISQALSVRNLSSGKIYRPIHSLEPRSVSNITDDEETLVEEVGYGIIRQLQRGMVLSVWSLVASLLLQNPMGITVEELVESVLWLKRHANNVGAYIDWPGGMTDLKVIESTLSSHSSVVQITAGRVTIAQVDHGDRLKAAKHINKQTLADAASHMILVIYRNQMVHAFTAYSILSMLMVSRARHTQTITVEKAKELFLFALKLFSKEFIFSSHSSDELFADALNVLIHTGDVVINPGRAINLNQSVTRFTSFLSYMLLPFASSYWVLCQFILHTTVDIGMGKETVIRPKQLVVSTQTFVLSLLNAGHLTDYELLNLDTLNNAVHSLRQMGAIYYETRNGEKFAAARIPQIKRIIANVEALATVPVVSYDILNSEAAHASLKHKL